MPLGLSNSWQVAEVRCSLEIELCEPGGGSGSRVSGRVSGRSSGSVLQRFWRCNFARTSGGVSGADLPGL